MIETLVHALQEVRGAGQTLPGFEDWGIKETGIALSPDLQRRRERRACSLRV